MLAENLMDKPHYSKSELEYPAKALTYGPNKEDNEGSAAGTGSDGKLYYSNSYEDLHMDTLNLCCNC